MKKWMTLLLSAAMLLSLAACGQQEEPPAESQQPPVREEEPAPPAEEAPAEQNVVLEYYLEGEPVTEPASRYAGDGYTVDIPAEGWLMETGSEEDFASVSWEPEVNDLVELEILELTGKTLEEAREWIRREEDDYDLIEDKRGGLGGSDPENRDVLEVRLFETEDGVLALLLAYPLEASEGFGTTLHVMADTLTLN